ncbi:MAG: hypothetical protein RI930_921 [Pseudomonadota bacterium]
MTYISLGVIQLQHTKHSKVNYFHEGALCWSIVDSIEGNCKEILRILDWFHVGMKFKNNSSAVAEEDIELYDKVKWNLWHGNPEKAIIRLKELCQKTNESKSKNKLLTLLQYIENNKDHIVNYKDRMSNSLPYTSNIAESTVNDLINARQKNKQRMTWSREGSHNVLQIRSSIYSKTWDNDWSGVEQNIYKNIA